MRMHCLFSFTKYLFMQPLADLIAIALRDGTLIRKKVNQSIPAYFDFYNRQLGDFHLSDENNYSTADISELQDQFHKVLIDLMELSLSTNKLVHNLEVHIQPYNKN